MGCDVDAEVTGDSLKHNPCHHHPNYCIIFNPILSMTSLLQACERDRPVCFPNHLMIYPAVITPPNSNHQQ